MKSSQRLKPIKKIAEHREKKAAQHLGESVEQRQNQTDKLTQLVNYRVEYVASMALKTQQGISGDQLHQYHQFLEKLDTAIAQQQTEVQLSEEQLSRNRNQWQTVNSRTTAINKAVDKLKNREVKIANRKESLQIDELTTQAFLRSKGH